MENSTNDQKHLLILSGPMGSGHVRAAAALEAWAHKKYPDFKVTNINVADYMSKFVRFLYERVYILLNNYFPLLWGFIYHQADAPPKKSKIGEFLFWARRVTSKKIMREIKRLNADYIICTHYLSAELLDLMKERKEISTPTASVVTDFSLNWIYVKHNLEYFFVASRELEFRLIHSGIPKEKIFISGIPVLPEFSQTFTEKELDQMKKDLGLPVYKDIVLVMMGGESKDKLTYLAEILLKHFDDLAFVVLPGKNEKVLNHLLEMKKDHPEQLFPVGFTNEVWRYLAVSTGVISKPGGISTSECLAMRKPLIIMYPIPGQEERNADYLLERSVVAKAYDEISLIYKDNLFTEERLEYMLKQIDKVRHPEAGYEILKVVLEDEDGKHFEDR